MKKTLYAFGILALLTAGFAVGKIAPSFTKSLGAATLITGNRIERSSTDIVRIDSIEIIPKNLQVFYHFTREAYDTSGNLVVDRPFEGTVILTKNATVNSFIQSLWNLAKTVEVTNPTTGVKTPIGGTVILE